MSQSYTLEVDEDGTRTIPSDLVRELGIDRSKRVLVLLEDGRIWVIPGLMTLDEIYGSIPALPNSTEDLDEEIEEAIADALHDRRS